MFDCFVIGKEYPAGGQVEGRIAGAQVAEVDHATEVSVRGEHVGWVQVPVEPQRLPNPAGCDHGVVPDRSDDVWIGGSASARSSRLQRTRRSLP